MMLSICGVCASSLIQDPRLPRRGASLTCQNHWNDAASSPIEPIEKSYDFPALPRTDTVLTNKSSRRFYCFNLLSDGGVPENPALNIGFIQPWLDAFLDQLLRYFADGWLVLAVVAQEDIKDFSFGVLLAHQRTI